uniref:Uncharacterized protein n=1 Tax=Arundo donax TaxID=35708 RepID=A0A0A9TIW4_ARUDO
MNLKTKAFALVKGPICMETGRTPNEASCMDSDYTSQTGMGKQPNWSTSCRSSI